MLTFPTIPVPVTFVGVTTAFPTIVTDPTPPVAETPVTGTSTGIATVTVPTCPALRHLLVTERRGLFRCGLKDAS